MSLRTCLHPNCHTVMKRRRQNCCGRHWHALPEEMRNRHKYATTEAARMAIQVEMRRFLESRLIGKHEVVNCRAEKCTGTIVYLPTVNGKTCPVDSSTVQATDILFDRDRHVAHFATCADPDSFRRPR